MTSNIQHTTGTPQQPNRPEVLETLPTIDQKASQASEKALSPTTPVSTDAKASRHLIKTSEQLRKKNLSPQLSSDLGDTVKKLFTDGMDLDKK